MINFFFMCLSAFFVGNNAFKIVHADGGTAAWLWLGVWVILGAIHTTLYRRRRAK